MVAIVQYNSRMILIEWWCFSDVISMWWFDGGGDSLIIIVQMWYFDVGVDLIEVTFWWLCWFNWSNSTLVNTSSDWDMKI